MRIPSRCLAFATMLCLFAAPPARGQISYPAQFITAKTVTVPAGVLSILDGVADFNRDGRSDILTESTSSNGFFLTVLLQNGNGTYTPLVSNLTPGQINQIADVNGDGTPDVLILNASPQSCDRENNCLDTGPATLTVALGNGDGTFRTTPTINLNTGGEFPSLLVRDFNGDGALDIAVTVGDAFASQLLQTLLNDGKGNFRAGPTPLNAQRGRLLAAGDFNGDGRNDLVMSTASSKLQILKGVGNGSFISGAGFPSLNPMLAAVGDFNRDGHPDLIVVNQDAPASLLLGNGNGTFKISETLNSSIVGPLGYGSAGIIPRSVTVHDLNHDGYPDIAFTYLGVDGAYVATFMNTGQGTFPTHRIYDTGSTFGFPGSLSEIADLNGDGNFDLLTTHGNNRFDISLGDKAGNFAAPLVTQSPASVAIASGDFNGNGKPDLAVVNQSVCAGCNASVSVYPGSGKSFSAKKYPITVPYGTIALGDINGDGKLDIVVTRSNDPTVQVQAPAAADISVLLGNGDGSFQPAINSRLLGAAPAGSTNTRTYLLDVNHDRKLDLIGDWGVALGTGDGHFFKPPVHFPAAIRPITAIAAGDFNRDGNLDLIVAQSGTIRGQILPAILYTLFGDGKGGFHIGHQQPLNFTFPVIRAIIATDLNGDGIPDLAYIYSAQPSNTFYTRLVVQTGLGNGSFAPGAHYPLPSISPQSPSTLLAADFNRDGHKDLLILSPFTQGDAALLRGAAGGKFTAPLQFYDGAGISGIVVDLNGDGAPDVAGTTTIGVSRMLNTGSRK